MAVKFNRNFNVNRLVKRLIYLVVGLLVGGLILSAFVDAFRGYCNSFFNGLSLLGVNITTQTIYDSNLTNGGDFNCVVDGLTTNCTAYASPALQSGCNGSSYVIGATGNLNGGILTVVGIIGVAGILMVEFVKW